MPSPLLPKGSGGGLLHPPGPYPPWEHSAHAEAKGEQPTLRDLENPSQDFPKVK